MKEQLDAAVATGKPFDSDHRVRRDDGHLAWVAARGQVRRDDTGRPTHLSGISFDIDARKGAEVRLSALVRLHDRLREPGDTADLAYASAQILGEALGVSRAGYGTIDSDAETITIERDWNAPGIASRSRACCGFAITVPISTT